MAATELHPATIAERLIRQRLAGKPETTAVAVARHLLAIQGQDPRGFRLAIRARSRGLTAADVDTALTDDRSLVVSWLNRGTLHLVAAEDHDWLHSLTTPQLATGNARRLHQEGVDAATADRAVAVIRRELTRHGARTRAELAEALTQAAVHNSGQALVHILFKAAREGVIVRGPMKGVHHQWVLAQDWLPRLRIPSRDNALAELARRYLDAHAPATDRDLAAWAGITLGDARSAFRAIASRLHERLDGTVSLTARPPRHIAPRTRLLGSFDPVLHGWASRDFIVGQHHGVVTSNGLFRPSLFVGGRAVGTWTLDGRTCAVSNLEPIAAEDMAALTSDADAVIEFLGRR